MEYKRSTNLCSVYVLPLLDLNKYSFGTTENFVNAYVNNDDSMIVVEVMRPSPEAQKHSLYRFSFEKDDRTFHVFEVPKKFLPTVKKFREGKYSLFQEEAKTLVKRRSGLTYRVPTSNGGVKTARELLALDKDKKLKEKLENDLGVKLDEDAELMDIPGSENFYTLNMTKSSGLEVVQ